MHTEFSSNVIFIEILPDEVNFDVTFIFVSNELRASYNIEQSLMENSNRYKCMQYVSKK